MREKVGCNWRRCDLEMAGAPCLQQRIFLGVKEARTGLGETGCLFCSWESSGIPKIDLE